MKFVFTWVACACALSVALTGAFHLTSINAAIVGLAVGIPAGFVGGLWRS